MSPLPLVVPASLIGNRLHQARWTRTISLRGLVIGDQLYIAADLSSLVIDGSYAHTCARDLASDGVTYRRFDAQLYAWCYQHMGMQKRLVEINRLTPEAWETYRQRFAVIYAWARAQLSEVTMATAHQRGPAPTYAPPRLRAA